VSHVRHQRRRYELDNFQGEISNPKTPSFDGERKNGDELNPSLLEL
jgi:hypothetical protein